MEAPQNYKVGERNDIAQITKFYETRGQSCLKEITLGGGPVKMHRVRRHCKTSSLSPNRLVALHNLDQVLEKESALQIRLEDVHRCLNLSSKPMQSLPLPAPLLTLETSQ
jgi:hypothetical protein